MPLTFEQLQELQDGWDEEDAVKPDEKCLAYLSDFLKASKLPIPDISPIQNGGIDLSWSDDKIICTIDLDEDDGLYVIIDYWIGDDLHEIQLQDPQIEDLCDKLNSIF